MAESIKMWLRLLVVVSMISLTFGINQKLKNLPYEWQKTLQNFPSWIVDQFYEEIKDQIKHKYSFVDKNPVEGKSYYRLKQIDFDGSFKIYNSVEVDYETVKEYSLSQNYPNPFNPNTEINFSIAKSGNVTLKVYNILGSEVATLVNGFMEAGKHSVKFSANEFTSGVYLYTIKADNFNSTRKMILMK